MPGESTPAADIGRVNSGSSSDQQKPEAVLLTASISYDVASKIARALRAAAVILRTRRAYPSKLRAEEIMGLFSKDIESMDDLFVHQLQDIYYAEKRIVGALPDMIAKATSPALKSAFEAHLGQTKNHIKRVEQVFQMHGAEPKQVDCPAIDGIIEEADEVGGEIEDKNVLDAALIASAQAVEHYEMTRYGTLIAWAKTLGRADCAQVLQQNLAEEKAADEKLTTLAENEVNRAAA
jgi:ferritin-like metal-binding protein YciE